MYSVLYTMYNVCFAMFIIQTEYTTLCKVYIALHICTLYVNKLDTAIAWHKFKKFNNVSFLSGEFRVVVVVSVL